MHKLVKGLPGFQLRHDLPSYTNTFNFLMYIINFYCNKMCSIDGQHSLYQSAITEQWTVSGSKLFGSTRLLPLLWYATGTGDRQINGLAATNTEQGHLAEQSSCYHFNLSDYAFITDSSIVLHYWPLSNFTWLCSWTSKWCLSKQILMHGYTAARMST